MLIYPKLPRTKPPSGSVQVNRSHPLAKNLADFWIFNETGGLLFVNAASGESVIATTTSAGPWRDSPFGRGPTFDGNVSSNFADIAIRTVPNGTPYTVWYGCVPTGTQSRASDQFNGFDSDNNVGTRWFQLRLLSDAGGNPSSFDFIPFNTIASPFTASTGGTWTANTWTTLAGTVTPSGAITNYGNGVSVGTDTLTGTIQSTNTKIRIGAFLGNSTSQQFVGTILVAGHWTYALPASFIKWLHAEPYTLLQPIPSVRYWSTPPAAAASASVVSPRSFGLLGVGA